MIKQEVRKAESSNVYVKSIIKILKYCYNFTYVFWLFNITVINNQGLCTLFFWQLIVYLTNCNMSKGKVTATGLEPTTT